MLGPRRVAQRSAFDEVSLKHHGRRTICCAGSTGFRISRGSDGGGGGPS